MLPVFNFVHPEELTPFSEMNVRSFSLGLLTPQLRICKTNSILPKPFFCTWRYLQVIQATVDVKLITREDGTTSSKTLFFYLTDCWENGK